MLLFENCTAGDSSALWIGCIYGVGTNRGAQTFTPSIAHVVTRVRLKLYREQNFSAVYHVHIYATDDGVPIGEALTSNSSTLYTSSLTLDDAGAFVSIDLDPYYLEASTKYAIVVICPTTCSAYSDYWIGWRYGTGNYAGGGTCWSTDEGETWLGPSVSLDFVFLEYGEPIPPYINTDNVAVDDGDGILDDTDEAAMIAAKTNYVRRFDINFDGVVDDDYDDPYFDNTRANNPNLGIIRANIRTETYQKLTWSGGWYAYLIQLVDDAATIQAFTGNNFVPTYGWTHINRHPYIVPEGIYSCLCYAFDMMIASYRMLGYGCLLFATSNTHGYNMFWIGGDWTDLNNWRIVEPQSGAILSAGQANLAAKYQTCYIYFPSWRRAGVNTVNCATLTVNYGNRTVAYYGTKPLGGIAIYDQQEENVPDPYTFDVSLGILGFKFLDGTVSTITGAVSRTLSFHRALSGTISVIAGSLNRIAGFKAYLGGAISSITGALARKSSLYRAVSGAISTITGALTPTRLSRLLTILSALSNDLKIDSFLSNDLGVESILSNDLTITSSLSSDLRVDSILSNDLTITSILKAD